MGKFDHLLKPRTKEYKHDATVWRRAGGLLIDILVIDLFLTGPFQSIFSRFALDPWSTAITQRELGAMFAIFCIAYAYFILFEFILGQTPGMMLLSMRLSTAPSIWQAFTRNLFLIPIFPLFLLWFIEPIVIFMTGKGILDRVSQTRIVHARRIIV